MMREELEYIKRTIDRMDASNLYEILHEIQTVLKQILEQLDKALPIDRSDDQ